MNNDKQQLWWRALVARYCSRWWLKALGISVYITLFMVVYFVLLRHPVFDVTVLSLQPLDHWVTLTPWAFWPYVSLWVYVALVPSLLLREEMAVYVSAATVVAVIGFGVFFFWPTAVPAFNIDWASRPLIAFLKQADAAGNACPSLHVAYAVLTGVWLGALLRRLHAPVLVHGLNIAWCVMIVWSTMALRQHVALDVETGTVLGVGVAGLHLAWAHRRGAQSSVI